MALSKEANDFINLFLPAIHKIKPIQKDNKKIFKELYKKIYLSHQYANLFIQNNEIQKTVVEIDEKNKSTMLAKYSLLKTDSFIQKDIKTNIYKNIKSIHMYDFKINGIQIYFHHVITSMNVNIDAKIAQYLKKIILMYHLLLSYYKTGEVESLQITYVPLTLKKKLPDRPGKILTSNNINTALTYPCKKNGEILIYRHEEWFKVLIHESMHSICYDFGGLNMGIDIKSILKNMFNVNSDFYITETYSEFWANIINTAILSFTHAPNKKSYSEFMQNFNILHQFEQLFSLFQCVKILDYMGLSYGEIVSKEAKDKNKCLRKYREDSNIFAYYILKSIWFFNSDIFLSWFDNHNTFLIYSQKTSNYLKNLLAMTKKYYNKDELLTIIKHIEKIFNTIQIQNKTNNDVQFDILETLQMSLF